MQKSPEIVMSETKHFPKIKAYILVVEDDRTHQEYVGQILRNIGCTPVLASNGKEALRLLSDVPFNLILMDIVMPEMNGIETALTIQKMKKEKKIADIPIIALTSSNDAAIKEACFDVGMIDFLPKDKWQPKWEPAIREKLLQWIAPASKPLFHPHFIDQEKDKEPK